MRIARSVAVAALLGVMGALVFPTAASADERTHFVSFTRLTGAEEVPGPGDPHGRGFALIKVDTEDGTICHALLVRRIEPATVAHIHIGGPGVAGPVVQGLEPPTDGFSSGCVENPGLAQELAEVFSGYHVNVHNTPYRLARCAASCADPDVAASVERGTRIVFADPSHGVSKP
jgi:hypothetical protein